MRIHYAMHSPLGVSHKFVALTNRCETGPSLFELSDFSILFLNYYCFILIYKLSIVNNLQ